MHVIRRIGIAAVRTAALSLALSVAPLVGAGCAQAWTFKTLYQFTLAHGADPGKLLRDDATGNLYGTTYAGGDGCGVVYKLAPDGTQTVLHAFTGQDEGCHPVDGRVARDDKGNLYGITSAGGDMRCSGGGCGVLYKLRPDGNYSVVHVFAPSGENAVTGLIRNDANGDLYGATLRTVFKLAADGRYTTLAFFDWPSGLILGPNRTLYGTTYYEGDENCHCGSIFRISHDASEILYSFKQKSLGHPSSLTMDEVGNLYGAGVGNHHGGSVFRLTPTNEMNWLYKFKGSGSTGPEGDLVLGPSGTLYGMTRESELFQGTLFQLDPDGTKSTLHVFSEAPGGGVIADKEGNLYGTTRNGGASYGTIYELVK